MNKLETKPFPYLIKDNAIDENLIDLMLQNWPKNNFISEAPGKYVCNILTLQIDEDLKDFWRSVRDKMVKKINKQIIKNFKPWIEERYGSNYKIFPDNVSLLTADEGSTEHCTHTHHYHAPHWVATVLIYLDEASNSNPGTSLHEYQSSCLEDDVFFAAKVQDWHGDKKLKEIEHARYKRNRMLIFYDNPICYHSVRSEPNAKGDRKIFRMHFSAPTEEVKKIYGVNLEEYTKIRTSFSPESPSPIVLDWLKKDINQLRKVKQNNSRSKIKNFFNFLNN